MLLGLLKTTTLEIVRVAAVLGWSGAAEKPDARGIIRSSPANNSNALQDFVAEVMLAYEMVLLCKSLLINEVKKDCDG